MSYKHLAGRLIETQRSMLGEPAIDIARSTEGITVTDDGNVAAVDGDPRVVVDELARRYTGMLGGAAETRLLAAAREFEDELALPPSLGGPEEFDAGHRDPAAHEPDGSGHETPGSGGSEPTSSDSDGSGHGTSDPVEPESTAPSPPSSGAVSDGGTTRVVSPTPTGPGERVSPTPGDAGRPDSTTESDERGADDAPAGEKTADVPVTPSEPITVEYSVASTVPAGERAGRDLASVYLMPADEGGFQAPVSVEDAVVDAITGATELGREDLSEFTDDIDTERLLATLSGENGETISFQIDAGDLTVTFHRTGSLAVH